MNGNDSTKTKLVYDTVACSIQNQKFEVACDNLKKNLSYICKKFAEFWKKYRRTKAEVIEFCSDWLNISETIILHCQEEMPRTSKKRGRPQKDFLLSGKKNETKKIS